MASSFADDELSLGGTGAMIGSAVPGLGTLAGGAIGLGLGLGKYFLADKPANDRGRALAAATQKTSPWTGLQGETPEQISPVGSGIQGAAAGAAQVQNMNNADANRKLQEAQISYLNRQGGAPGTQTGIPMRQDAMGRYPGSPTWSNLQGMQEDQMLQYPGVPGSY